ncbi:MAG: ferrous iron transport protein B [Bacteroidetes bacterium GWF2_41_61]|nr:MAG: ferrous iron transport protein B [Bacteroidetes bacterium GWE2_40_15]OFY28881.1 MAG: ferrous iron transport protein B [Bacteroidetes bacterium GWF2_41_61]OFY89205.1 MAG: ferrous iron transport protein B [Bacteroidetes bacterium RIFOXYA12_FULL_40_10]HBG24707.1 ferrous iron transport protein B [Rikenellaceae bacterium]HBZ26311.1 ferrous iron transport protein B [Rikenellaceae bacterium]
MSHEKNSKPVVSFDQSTYRKGNFKHKHHGRGEGPEKEGRKHEKRHKHHFGRQYEYSEEQTRRADSFLTHPIWGLVSFIFIIWMIFFFTFRLGAYPQAGIEWLMDKGALFIQESMAQGWVSDFLSQGVIMGVGSVLAFLPNILILFFFLSLLQETEYISRAATIMDRYMHKIGLHGSSFIPLLMGFGCNVPAIMATRTIKRKSDRILTMLMIPYIPCSARIPTFLLFSGIFFPDNQVLALSLLYFGGILTGVFMALLFKRLFFNFGIKDYAIPLPCYKRPSFIYSVNNMWDAAWEYVKKIGTVVLLAVIIVWALDYLPLKDKSNPQVERVSYLERFGKVVEPALAPLGFDWKMSVSLVTGITAKEFIISTLGVVYKSEEVPVEGEQVSTSLMARIKEEEMFNKANALSFMIFSLLYMPCVATAYTIRKETGTWKWALLSIFSTIAVAWIAAFFAYKIGLLILV